MFSCITSLVLNFVAECIIKKEQFKYVKYGYPFLSVAISDVVVCGSRLLIVALLTLPYLSIIIK